MHASLVWQIHLGRLQKLGPRQRGWKRGVGAKWNGSLRESNGKKWPSNNAIFFLGKAPEADAPSAAAG
jgi:hypothetical protein